MFSLLTVPNSIRRFFAHLGVLRFVSKGKPFFWNFSKTKANLEFIPTLRLPRSTTFIVGNFIVALLVSESLIQHKNNHLVYFKVNSRSEVNRALWKYHTQGTNKRNLIPVQVDLNLLPFFHSLKKQGVILEIKTAASFLLTKKDSRIRGNNATRLFIKIL